MSLDELLQGLGAFKQGMQEFAVGNAIGQAQEQVNQLKAAQMNEMEKRNALQGLANDLALNLGRVNAPVAQIQSAVGAIAPAPIKNSTDAFVQGMPEYAQKLQTFEAAPEAQAADKQRSWMSNEKALDRQLELMKEKLSGRNLKALTATEVKDYTAIENDLALGKDLLVQVENNSGLVGPVAGRIPFRGKVDEKFAAFEAQTKEWFNSYRQRITGAGASNTELEVLEKNRPTANDTPLEYKAKTKKILEVGELVRKRTLLNYGRAGRDITGFLSTKDEAALSGAAESTSPPVRKADRYKIQE